MWHKAIERVCIAFVVVGAFMWGFIMSPYCMVKAWNRIIKGAKLWVYSLR